MAGELILVVEDNVLNMKLTVDILEAVGYSVSQAVDARKGIELARAENPALILMDVDLPGLDGLAATRILRADPATKDIPVIALTAHAMKGDEEKALQAGCDGYVTKPINTRSLAQTVARFIAGRNGTPG